MKVIVRKLNTFVLILPPSYYVLQVEVYRRRRKTQALAGTTFAETLKPLFVYHFHRCVDNYHKVVQVYGCVCGMYWWWWRWKWREDATTKEGMRWSKQIFMSCLQNFFYIEETKSYIIDLKKDTIFSKCWAFLDV